MFTIGTKYMPVPTCLNYCFIFFKLIMFSQNVLLVITYQLVPIHNVFFNVTQQMHNFPKEFIKTISSPAILIIAYLTTHTKGSYSVRYIKR